MTMLNNENLSWDVEKAVELIAVLTQVSWLHRMKASRSLQQKGCCFSVAIHGQIGGKYVAFFSTPIVRYLIFAHKLTQKLLDGLLRNFPHLHEFFLSRCPFLIYISELVNTLWIQLQGL